jgi:hypothetical protein
VKEKNKDKGEIEHFFSHNEKSLTLPRTTENKSITTNAEQAVAQ